MFKYFKNKWGLKSNFQLIIILIVFAITGSGSLYISAPVMDLFSKSINFENFLSYWLVRFFVVTLIYQFVLLVVAFIFGQFNWFWNFEKRILKKLGFFK